MLYGRSRAVVRRVVSDLVKLTTDSRYKHEPFSFRPDGCNYREVLLTYLVAVEHFTTALRRAGVRTFDQRRHVSIANVGGHHDGPRASLLCGARLMEDWRAVWLGFWI